METNIIGTRGIGRLKHLRHNHHEDFRVVQALLIAVLMAGLYALAGPAWADSAQSKMSPSDAVVYQQKSYPGAAANFQALGLTACQSTLKISEKLLVTVCNQKTFDNKDDYGLRVLLLDSSRNKVLYRSKGGFDSYYTKLSAFTSEPADDIVIIGESGAEFSYGLEAYLIHNDRMRFAGYISLTVEDEHGNQASLAPFVKVRKLAGKFEFSFTKDVLEEDRGNYTTIPKDKIKYIYDGKKMHKILK